MSTTLVSKLFALVKRDKAMSNEQVNSKDLAISNLISYLIIIYYVLSHWTVFKIIDHSY